MSGFLLSYLTGFSVFSQETAVRFPSGVEIIQLRAGTKLPEGFEASAIRADWAQPGLKTELLTFEELKPRVPRKWDLICTDLSGVCIQLIDPRKASEGEWETALPWAPAEHNVCRPDTDESPADPRRSNMRGSWISLGKTAPWILAGERINREPEWLSPLSALPESALIGVGWMGPCDESGKRLSTTESFKRCMISVTSPRRGSTRFIMIRRNRPGRFSLFDLRQWLESETDDDEWTALHSTGFHTSISTAEWDMPLGLREAGVKRLGVALHLSERDPVEINLMHRDGVRIKASSHERDFPPAYIVGGHFFHHPLEPRLWISRPSSKDPLPWIEVEFPEARKINRLRLIWAIAAGWSQEYNPILISFLTSNEWGGSLYEIKSDQKSRRTCF